MQDFTKLNNQDLPAAPVMTNEYGGIYDKQKQPWKGFVKARLNKDNFWNLVFGLGIPIGLMIPAVFSEPHHILSRLILLCTILGIPLLVRTFNKVTFTTENKFLNSQGEDITSRIPTLFWSLIFSFTVTALVGNIIDNHGKNLPLTLGAFLSFFILFFSFSLRFIYYNCPISVFFTKGAWTFKGNGVNSSNNYSNITTSSSSLRDDLYSPSRSYLSSNVYHRSR